MISTTPTALWEESLFLAHYVSQNWKTPGIVHCDGSSCLHCSVPKLASTYIDHTLDLKVHRSHNMVRWFGPDLGDVS